MCDIILCMSQQGINEKGNSKLKKKKIIIHIRQESEYIWETFKTTNMVYRHIADNLHWMLTC